MLHLLATLLLYLYRKVLIIMSHDTEYHNFVSEKEKEFQRLKSYAPDKYDSLQLFNKKYCDKRWNEYVKKHFDKKNPEAFYHSWIDDIGALAISINIHDQFRRYELYQSLKKYIQPNHVLLDVGCGSAALYWEMLKANDIFLVDLPNENQKYVEFKSQYDSRKHVCTLSNLDQNLVFDTILIIDVLEHLENPSQFFVENVHRRLKIGGLLFIQAPWGGHPEHLPESPKNWSQHGNMILKENYKLVDTINSLFYYTHYYLSGVYKKISD